MKDIIVSYLKSLLDETRAASQCDWIGIFGGSSEPFCSTLLCSSGAERVVLGNSPSQSIFPLVFSGVGYGTLVCRSEKGAFFGRGDVMERLEAFASQLSALLANSELEKAILLDQRIAELHRQKKYFDWTGIYRVYGETLRLSVFRGAPTPHIIIPTGQGICGAAVRENRTLNVQDVSSDPRYLSCDARTRSEIVVPIRDAKGNAIGEIDIDSHTPSAFTNDDISRVEELARELSFLMIE